MKKERLILMTILLGFFIFLFGSGGFANEAKDKNKEEVDMIRLEPINVIGKKVKGRRVPAVVESLTPKDFKVMNLLGTEDVFKYLPGSYVRKIYAGSTNMPLVIRGNSTFMSARTLVLADDIMLTNLLGAGHGYAPRWQMVAPEEIERVDMIYGPFSALYSGNSMGGAAIIKTKLPDKQEIHFDLGYLFHNFREYKTDEDLNGYTAHFSFGNRINKFRFFALYDRYDNEVQPISYITAFEDDGAPPVGNPVSGYDSDIAPEKKKRYIFGSQGRGDIKNNLFKVKLGYDLNDYTQLEFDWAYWDHDQDYKHPETYLRDSTGNKVYSGIVDVMGKSFKIKSNKFYYRENDNEDYLYALTFRRELEGGLSIKATGSYYDINKDLSKKSSSSPPNSENGGPGTVSDRGSGWYTFDIKSSYTFESPGIKTHNFTLGYHYDKVFTDSETWNASDWKHDIRTSLSLETKGKTDMHAVFLEDIWDLSDRWSIYLGCRYESWRAFDGSKSRDVGSSRIKTDLEDREEDYFSPKFAVSFRPNNNWSIRYSFAKAYRFPTVGEMYQGGIDSSGYITKTNPNLNSEKAYANDVTIRRKLGEGGEARITGFVNLESDSIFKQTNIYTMEKYFQNVDEVRTWGIEFEVQKENFLTTGLNTMFNLAYTDSEIIENEKFPESEGKDFPRVPTWRIKGVVSYAPIDNMVIAVSGRYASEQYNTLDNSDSREGYGAVDDYLVFDTKVSYTVRQHFTASIGVDNITDELYHVYHPYPRRTFYFTLRTDF